MSAARQSIFKIIPRARAHSEPGEASRTADFETAALPHLNELMRAAVRLAGSRLEAEDLIQETYCQAWKSFHRFELGTNCRAWLFRILFHKANQYRSRLFWRKTDNCEAKLMDALSYTPPVNEMLIDEEILGALERLPGCYREVVLMVDVEELSYREVAGILQVPIGTVMSRLSRGRKLLRVELTEVAEAYGIRGRMRRIKGPHAA